MSPEASAMAVEPLRSVNITVSTRWNFSFIARSSCSRFSSRLEISCVLYEEVLELVDLHARRGIGRIAAGDRVVEDAAQRVQIGPGALLDARRVLLERRIAGSHHRREGLRAAAQRVARGAEIDQHRIAALAHEDVLRLDVAV